jgi:hypothetical protein
MMKTECALREREVIFAEYHAIAAHQQTAGTLEFQNFLAGARAALEWVLGRTTTTPATGCTRSVTIQQMEQEERFSDEVIYSATPRPLLDRDYANGVEHALSWARGAETVPPTPVDRDAQDVRRACTCG